MGFIKFIYTIIFSLGNTVLFFVQHEKEKSNPWLEIHSISKKLKFFAVLILVWTASDVVFIIAYYFNTLELPLIEALLWMFPLLIFTFIFFKHRKRGNDLFKRFNKEVEDRLVQGRSTQIPKDKSRSLKNYLLLSELRFLKGILICFGIGFAFILAPAEVVLIFKKGPEPIKNALNKSILRKEGILVNLEKSMAQSKNSFLQLDKSNKNHLKYSSELQNSLWKHYRTIGEVQLYRAKTYQIRNAFAQGLGVEAIETLLRNESPTIEEIKGYMKVKLNFSGEDVVQSEKLIRQPEAVINMSGSLLNHYDEILYDAQNSSYRDYLEMKKAEEQIAKNKKAMDKIILAIKNDSLTVEKFKNFISEDKKLVDLIK